MSGNLFAEIFIKIISTQIKCCGNNDLYHANSLIAVDKFNHKLLYLNSLSVHFNKNALNISHTEYIENKVVSNKTTNVNNHY